MSFGSEAASSRSPFPRPFRLRRARDFERVFARPLRSGGARVRMLARANHLGGARLGMAISRKRVPKAVCRNRIKRVTRDSFRRHRRELRNLDIVMLAGLGLDGITNADLRTLLAEHWRRLAHRGAAPGSR